MFVCIYNFTFKVVICFEEMDISCGILSRQQCCPPAQQSSMEIRARWQQL